MSANAIDSVCKTVRLNLKKKKMFMLINLGFFFPRHCIYRNNVCVACFDICLMLYPLKTDQTAACSLQTFNS